MTVGASGSNSALPCIFSVLPFNGRSVFKYVSCFNAETYFVPIISISLYSPETYFPQSSSAREYASAEEKNSDETKGFEGHIDCGYISQQLQEINSSFVTEVEQEDGTILLQPLASALLPHMSKAIQEQQEKIEELEKIILELKSKIGA